MFDLGWMELLIIGVTALVVVGPKDLPKMFKTIGTFVGKAKRMAREFQSTMEEAAEDTGLKEASDIIKTIESKSDPKNFFKKAIDDVSNLSEGKFENDKKREDSVKGSEVNLRSKSKD